MTLKKIYKIATKIKAELMNCVSLMQIPDGAGSPEFKNIISPGRKFSSSGYLIDVNSVPVKRSKQNATVTPHSTIYC